MLHGQENADDGIITCEIIEVFSYFVKAQSVEALENNTRTYRRLRFARVITAVMSLNV
jgi:hypothetical protein